MLCKSLEGDKRTDVTCVFAGLLLFKPSMNFLSHGESLPILDADGAGDAP